MSTIGTRTLWAVHGIDADTTMVLPGLLERTSCAGVFITTLDSTPYFSAEACLRLGIPYDWLVGDAWVTRADMGERGERLDPLWSSFDALWLLREKPAAGQLPAGHYTTDRAAGLEDFGTPWQPPPEQLRDFARDFFRLGAVAFIGTGNGGLDCVALERNLLPPIILEQWGHWVRQHEVPSDWLRP